MNRKINENYSIKCAECQRNIYDKELKDFRGNHKPHLKKNGTYVCCCCMLLCKRAKTWQDWERVERAIDKACFKCDKNIPYKSCYSFRNLWITNEGEKIFCDDCALSESENMRLSWWYKRTSVERYEDVKDAIRIRSEHNCLRCHPNAKTCSYCNNAFIDKGCTCVDCGKVYCSCCCMSRALKCEEQQIKKNQDNQSNSVKLIVDNENNSKKIPAKSPGKLPDEAKNQTLIINLKSVRQITLTSDDNLVIEFNKTETNSNSVKEIQVIDDKQIENSQELQKVKSYLKESGSKSINQQKLNSILTNNTNSELTDNINKPVLIAGLSIVVILTVGLAIRLLIKRKPAKGIRI
jgi:hypothetical protein